MSKITSKAVLKAAKARGVTGKASPLAAQYEQLRRDLDGVYRKVNAGRGRYTAEQIDGMVERLAPRAAVLARQLSDRPVLAPTANRLASDLRDLTIQGGDYWFTAMRKCVGFANQLAQALKRN